MSQKQTVKTFTPYVTEVGGKIELVENGIVDAASMFASAQASNRMLTWIIRVGGFVLMLIGFNLLFKPLSVMADVVPLFGNIVGMGTGFVAFILARNLLASNHGHSLDCLPPDPGHHPAGAGSRLHFHARQTRQSAGRLRQCNTSQFP